MVTHPQPLLVLVFQNLWRWLLLTLLGLTLGWLIINFSLSWQWIDRPFPGFLHQNRIITKTDFPGWQSRQLRISPTRIEPGDLILMVDGQPLGSSEQLFKYLSARGVGHSISYLVRHRDGKKAEASLAVVRFTRQDFLQLGVIPAFIALLALLTAAAAVYAQTQSAQVKLFTFVAIALAFILVSLPDFVIGDFFFINFMAAMIGKILLPPLLVHFLLVFPYPRKVMVSWPALLPLLYAAVAPALLYLPALLARPELMPRFNTWLNAYLIVYILIGAGLLLEAILQPQTRLSRRQALIFLLGLLLPSLLAVTLNIWLENSFNRSFIIDTVEQYGLIGLPIAAVFAALRYQVFHLKQSQRVYGLYLSIIGGAPVAYILLVTLVLSTKAGFEFIRLEDLVIITPVVVAFFLMRPAYQGLRDRLEQRLYGSVENYRVGLRIFLQELIKVKSRHDLEALVSLNLAADFGLQSAELTPGSRPSSGYALRLPLTVNNVSLGTLFLGSKINDDDFTERELAILAELQRQAALALWSLELDTAIHTTEELTRLKSKFLANVTHELRTPLNSIINYIGFVVDEDAGPLNPEQQQHLTQALAGAEKLLQIINNILDISKIEAGQMSLRLGQVSLSDLIAETLPQIQPAIERKPVEITTHLAMPLPQIRGDRLRLRQILLNLLANAAKFTEAGKVDLSAHLENGHIVIQVADTGAGIDPLRLPTIFEQFTREDLTDQAEHTGAGLSLPITKALVELHGGQIQITSQPGQGTVVTVKLPAQQF